MRLSITVAVLAFGSTAYAQSITIVEAIERDSTVEITVETDIIGPIEVMAGVDLFNQDPDDVYIGATERVKIEHSPQTLIIPITEQDGNLIPAGEYEATVSFYPWWGADDAPAETQELMEQINATLPISIEGSGIAASEVQKSKNAYARVREYIFNLEAGKPFDNVELTEHLGPPERLEVTNRSNAIVGWYYKMYDVTVFQNTNNGEIVTWRSGRQDAL